MAPVDPTETASWPERVALAAREIARYLDEHPHASDTLNGVRDFWVPDLGESVGPDVLQLALDRLVAAGTLEARRVPGGQVIYACGKRVRP